METNVEAKTVVVQADESVSPHSMLEKLQKVGGEPSTTIVVPGGRANFRSLVSCCCIFASRLSLRFGFQVERFEWEIRRACGIKFCMFRG